MASSQLQDLNIAKSGADGQDGLKIWSCTNCRKRKVRCDRRFPCVHCTRLGSECVFPAYGRLPRRSRKPNAPESGLVARPPSKKNIELLNRLRNLESIVSDITSQVEYASSGDNVHSNGTGSTPGGSLHGGTSATQHSSGSPDLQPFGFNNVKDNTSSVPSSSDIDDTGHRPDEIAVGEDGNIVVGQRFWSIFCNEVEHVFEAARGSEPCQWELEHTARTGEQRPHISYFTYLRQQSEPKPAGCITCPPPSHMLFLWQTFVDIIDPFTKVLHVPSFARMLREVKGGYDSCDSEFKAVLFAVSYAAVFALTEDEVTLNFNAEKNQLFARYRLGVEQALDNADFMRTSSLTVLQAATIYITILHSSGESESAWPLCGLLSRVAGRQWLHQDPCCKLFSPFETEMRRRVWWQICLLDSRVRFPGSSGFLISPEMFTTRLPACIDEVDMDQAMKSQPHNRDARTDMTISLICCEVWRLSRQIRRLFSKPDTSRGEARAVFDDMTASIEAKYLRHLNLDQDLDAFVEATMRLAFTKIDIILDAHSRTMLIDENRKLRPVPDEGMRNKFLSVIESSYALHHNPRWSSWFWATPYQPPLEAMASILHHLCSGEWAQDRERAWFLVERSFRALPSTSHERPWYRKLDQLMQKASHNRKQFSESSSSEGRSELLGPSYSNSHSSLVTSSTKNSAHNESWSDMLAPMTLSPTVKQASLRNSPDSRVQDDHLGQRPHQSFGSDVLNEPLAIMPMDWQPWGGDDASEDMAWIFDELDSF